MSNLTEMLKINESFANNINVKKRFEDMLGERAPQFMVTVLNLLKGSEKLQKCDPMTIWNAALAAAALDLPVDGNLGYAYIVPYGDKAQFQMGYKGIKQLALRASLYKHINAGDVRQGEIKKRNRLTGEITLDFLEDAERENAPVIGYFSYFICHDGYSSLLYMTVEELTEHAKKYSKSYQSDIKNKWTSSLWSNKDEFPKMCIKTVTKLNLSRNGILSAQMRQAFKNDQAVIYDDKVAYEDNPETEALRAENEELKRLNAYLSEKLLAAPDTNNSEVSEGESTDESDKQ